MHSQEPQIAILRDRDRRRLLCTPILARRLLPLSQPGQQLIDIALVEAYALELALLVQLLQKRRKPRLIPSSEPASPIASESIGRGLDAVALKPDHGDLVHVELAGSLQPCAPRDNLAGPLGHNGLP